MIEGFSHVYIQAVSKSYAKIKAQIPLSEKLKNPIGKSYIGNLDTPSTHIHDHSLIDGEY